MKRSKRLEAVYRLAKERAAESARAYAEQQERLDQERERIAQLHGFRREYEQKLLVSAGHGIDACRLRDYNAFLARIDKAVCQQQQSLTRLEAEVAGLRLTWLEQWGSSQALEQLVARYRREERRTAAGRDQRLHDEFAQRQSGRSNDR